jgi:hypothetical protein
MAAWLNRKTNSPSPRRMRDPSVSWASPTRTPSTQVPWVLPKSLMMKFPDRIAISACWRDILGSRMLIEQAGSRPSRIGSSPSPNRLSAMLALTPANAADRPGQIIMPSLASRQVRRTLWCTDIAYCAFFAQAVRVISASGWRGIIGRDPACHSTGASRCHWTRPSQAACQGSLQMPASGWNLPRIIIPSQARAGSAGVGYGLLTQVQPKPISLGQEGH